MHICLDNLGDGFITFPEFQRQLIALEREQDQRAATLAAYTDNVTTAGLTYAMKFDAAQGALGSRYTVLIDPTLPPAAPSRCHHGVPTQYTCKACADEQANDGR